MMQEPPIERTDRDSLCDALDDPAEEEAVRRQRPVLRQRRGNGWLNDYSESARLEWEAEKLVEAEALFIVLGDEPAEGYDPDRDDPNAFNPDDPFDRPEEEGRRAAARYTSDL